MKTLHIYLIATLIGLIPFCRGFAQNDTPTPSFDLVLFGKNLDRTQPEIRLKTNPWLSDEWENLKNNYAFSQSNDSGGEYSMITISGIPAERFIGGDIRENYLALRVRAAASGTSLHAVYAIPQGENPGISQLFALIKDDPIKVQQLSLASHVWPRPFILEPRKTATEHIEAPVRHLKPGIQEVKWLDILFTPL